MLYKAQLSLTYIIDKNILSGPIVIFAAFHIHRKINTVTNIITNEHIH